MNSIRAQVNTRLLTKASRLFTGTLAGRIVEILQNARRAGARHVVITNREGQVTVRDDGRGIRDFQKLLDLGGSDWDNRLEASEDPAGVGLFCLAPRPLTIRSRGHKVSINENGWTGAPIAVEADSQPLPMLPPNITAGVGTELSFADDPWNADTVTPCAVFTGLEVTVDEQPCPKERFINGLASSYPELGCRIQVVTTTGMTQWHRSAILGREYGSNVLLDFHGQVVAFDYRPVSHHDLHFLVDMTGKPTGIRLMLPARTCLVENEAYQQLKAALEREAFLHLQQQGRHHLPYKEYLRAKELGIELPEAEPTYHVGLLHTDMQPDPVEVVMLKDHTLAQCYRLADITDGVESDEPNVHLLAALGQFAPPHTPLVPVEIKPEYDGYSWARLPTIGRVEVTAGKVLQESWIGSGTLVCVDSLGIRVHCSDGKVFHSPVCLAVKPPAPSQKDSWLDQVYVTREAQRALAVTDIWYHLGGFSDEGDTYDTQEEQFRTELENFWMRLAGPHETIRSRLMEATRDLAKGWREITIRPDGTITVRQKGNRQQVMSPPTSAHPHGAQEVSS